MGLLKWFGGGAGGEPPARSEGGVSNEERLAMILSIGSEDVANRIEILEVWNEKREAVRAGYLRRAKRLLAAWGDE